MSIITTSKNQWRKIQSLDRSAKLFISLTVMGGILFAGWELFFNFYILAKGFDKEFLGKANSLYPLAVLIFSIPMGMVSDKIGRKRALITGQFFFLFTFMAITLTNNGNVILIGSFIGGMVDSLYIVSVNPLLAQLSSKANRNFLFSLNWGLSTLSRVVGSFLAGQMPSFFENTFGIQTSTASSYQAVLATSVGLTFLTLIPLIMIKLPEKILDKDENGNPIVKKAKNGSKENLQNILKSGIVWKFFIPNLLIGLGAALIIPYINLFFVEKFSINDKSLGLLFSIGALITGLAVLFGPKLADRMGTRIRAVTITQGASLVFLLLFGFTPFLGIAIFGFLARGALMNMGNPLFESFAMDQVSEDEQGALNSILIFTWEIGWAVGPFISGVIQESYGYNPLFIATTILYGIGISLIYFFFRNHETAPKDEPALKLV